MFAVILLNIIKIIIGGFKKMSVHNDAQVLLDMANNLNVDIGDLVNEAEYSVYYSNEYLSSIIEDHNCSTEDYSKISENVIFYQFPDVLSFKPTGDMCIAVDNSTGSIVPWDVFYGNVYRTASIQ